MRVKCVVDYITLENDAGYAVDSVSVTCPRCGSGHESYGESEASVTRCLVLLREDCPKGENNFYVAHDGGSKQESYVAAQDSFYTEAEARAELKAYEDSDEFRAASAEATAIADAAGEGYKK